MFETLETRLSPSTHYKFNINVLAKLFGGVSNWAKQIGWTAWAFQQIELWVLDGIRAQQCGGRSMISQSMNKPNKIW